MSTFKGVCFRLYGFSLLERLHEQYRANVNCVESFGVFSLFLFLALINYLIQFVAASFDRLIRLVAGALHIYFPFSPLLLLALHLLLSRQEHTEVFTVALFSILFALPTCLHVTPRVRL